MKPALKLFINLYAKHFRHIVLISMIQFFDTFLIAIGPYINIRIIDYGITKHNMSHFLYYSLLYFLIYILELSVSHFSLIISEQFSLKIKKNLFSTATNYLLSSEGQYISRGNVQKILSNELNLFYNCIFSFPISVINYFFSLLISLFALLVYAKKLSIVLIFFCVISFFIRNRVNKLLKKQNKILYKENIRYNTILIEFLDFFKSIKRIHSEFFLQKRINNSYEACISKEFLSFKSRNNIVFFSKLNDHFFSTTILIITGIATVLNSITLGIMFSICKYSTQLLSNISQLLTSINYIYINQCELNEIIKILSFAHHNDNKILNKVGDFNSHHISVSNLSFYYGDLPIFINTSFILKTGKINFITGKSGIGKTSLLRLIINELSPSSGAINISSQSVYMVQQEPIIFNSSISNNIVLDKEFCQNKLDTICSICCLDSEISQMKDGVNTVIHEKALNISDGQKKRICIARALYANPSILIMDEPTTNLDICSAKKIISFFKEYSRKHLVVIITHDNDIIDKYSRKYVIRDYKIWRDKI